MLNKIKIKANCTNIFRKDKKIKIKREKKNGGIYILSVFSFLSFDSSTTVYYLSPLLIYCPRIALLSKDSIYSQMLQTRLSLSALLNASSNKRDITMDLIHRYSSSLQMTSKGYRDIHLHMRIPIDIGMDFIIHTHTRIRTYRCVCVCVLRVRVIGQ